MKKRVKCREEELRLLLEASEMDAGRLRTRHIQTVAVLEILTQNVRECAAVHILFVQEGGNVPVMPCVQYNGPDLTYASNLLLHVDREVLFSVSNAEEGIAALVAAHWLLNIEYPHKAFNILVAMEWLLLGQRVATPRMPVVKLLNTFKKS
nr:uncharacterized protein LOC129381289 [Dermacentor andersoni]